MGKFSTAGGSPLSRLESHVQKQQSASQSPFSEGQSRKAGQRVGQ